MIMKFTVEIVDNKFKYEYEIGKSRSAGEMPFGFDGLSLFTALIGYLDKSTFQRRSDRNKAFDAFTFAKANPDLMEEVEELITGKERP